MNGHEARRHEYFLNQIPAGVIKSSRKVILVQNQVSKPVRVNKNPIHPPIIQDPSSDLFDDLQNFLEKGDLADVILTCGSETIRAHKMMLCARSAVFAAMFTSPMQENDDNKVIIDDITPQVVRDLLLFIYSGRAKNLTLQKTSDLIYAAEKYQIISLKNVCLQFLRSITTVENATQILEIANLYDEQLKIDTIKFMSEHFNSVKCTEEWKILQLENPALAVKVYAVVVESLQVK